jgi:hypothetical protein
MEERIQHALTRDRMVDITNPAQKLHQVLSSGLPRSGMEFSSQFSLYIWLVKPPLSTGKPLVAIRYHAR